MENNTNNSLQDLVSQVLGSPTFRTLVLQAVSNFNTRRDDVNVSTIQATSPSEPSTSSHCDQLTAGRSQNTSTPSLIQNLKALFPSTRGKMPSFSKLKKKNHHSTVFYRDVILLKNPKAICTLKGARKSEAFDVGLALSDVKFDCIWNKEQILEYLNGLFPTYLQDVLVEILFPESGRLIRIDESREPLDGYKLKRLFQNRKVVYLRPFSDLPTSSKELKSGYDSNHEDLSLCSTVSVIDADLSIVNEDNLNNLETQDVDHDLHNESDEEEIQFRRDLKLAYERSMIKHDEDEDVTLKDLLTKLSRSVRKDSSTKFNIYRNEVLSSCMRATSRKKFDPFAKICVTFSDGVENSEGALDAGGPTREMFCLLLKELKNGTLFEGSEKKYISFNSTSLEKNEYCEAGKLIALAIAHIGQGPTFFSDLLFSVIVHGIQNTQPTEEFVDENTVLVINKLRNMTNLESLQDLVVNEPIFTYAGVHFIFKLEEKEEILRRVLKFFCFYRVKAAIDQFVEGLKTCGVYDLMVTYPDLFYPLMCTDPPLTSEIIFDLFQIDYSALGSNKRERENKTVAFWRDYVLDCEEAETVDEGVTLEEILIFVTGSRGVPALGFTVKPSIHFLHDDERSTDSEVKIRYLPEANTCALELYLHITHKTYGAFKEDMDYGIKNCKVFGKA